MMKRKSPLVVLVVLMVGSRMQMVLVVCHLEEEGEEAEAGGEAGSKVGGRGEDMGGEEEEVGREGGEEWTEEVGEDQEGWIGDVEEVEWKEEAGVHQVVWTGEGEGGAEVGWKGAWKVEEEDGVTGVEEHPWREGGGLEIGDGVVDSQEVEEEDLTHLYLCSTISRRCPIHQEAEPVMNRKLLEMMMKTTMRIRLSLGGERRARIVGLEEGVGEEAGEWRRLVLVGETGGVQEEIGEAREEEGVVPGDQEEGVLGDQEEVLVVIEEVLEELG